MAVNNKNIKKPTDVRRVLAEQINLLRNSKSELTKSEIDKARAIGYLCSIALTAIKDGDLEKRLELLESLNGVQ